MVDFSDKMVRCNFCLATFPREKGVVYSPPRNTDPKIAVLCPECKKGHLWLLNLEVDEEQLKKDRYNREHPTHSEKTKDGMHRNDRDMPDKPPNFGTRLGKGFKMLGNDE